MNGTTPSTTNAKTSTTASTTSTIVSSSASTSTAPISEWKKQLITKEDPYHLHKTLGILVLLSYIYRIYIGLFQHDDMGFTALPQYTIPTVLLHFMLNATSFIFKIPSKRISSGYRIWPEYRLHSFIFLCRNLFCITLFYIEANYYNHHQYHIMNWFVVLLTMAAADIASMTQDTKSGFARELDVPSYVKYFFSMAQLGATAMILFGQRRYTIHFIMIIIIQGNAFLMTIRRKNLASHTVLTSIYGIALLSAGIVAHYEYSLDGTGNARRTMAFIGFTATLLRTGPRIIPGLSIIQNNKYLLWTVLYYVQETYIRPHLHEPMSLFHSICHKSVIVAAILLGLYKHYKEQQQKVEKKGIKIKSV